METKHVLHQQDPGFCHRGELQERHKMCRPGEKVNDGQHNGVAVRRWETCDKVQGDMGPGSSWGGKGVQESGRCLVGGLSPGAHGASGTEFPGVAGQGRPPEPLTEKVEGAGNASRDEWAHYRTLERVSSGCLVGLRRD